MSQRVSPSSSKLPPDPKAKVAPPGSANDPAAEAPKVNDRRAAAAETDDDDDDARAAAAKSATAGPDDAAANSEADDAPASEEESLRREVEKLKAELKERDRLLLLARADYDNCNKRAQKQVADARLTGSANLMKDLLPVVSSFDSAMKHLQEKISDPKVVEGFEMLSIQFTDVLEKNGLKEIKALNARFDTNLHEALMREERTDIDEDTVTAVLEKGYTLHDKVLRPARVKVSYRP